MRTSDIRLSIQLDENNVPDRIDWEAEDGGVRSTSKAVLLALWDEQEKNTMRIDLWTKDMMVDEMVDFYYQSFMGMADTLQRSTGQAELVNDLRHFAQDFFKKFQEAQRRQQTT